MLKDWYLRLNTSRFPAEFSKLTYALMDARYSADSAKVCRMGLYYNNPDYEDWDETVPYNAEDPHYSQHTNYRIEINPTALDFSGSVSFANQVMDIIEEAEKIIAQKQNVYKQNFSVPGSAVGMQDCDPTPGEFTLEHSSTEPDEINPSGYVSVVNVDLAKLQADVKLYTDYRTNERKQANKAAQSKVRKGANLLDRLENLTPEKMIEEVNRTLKRQKISAASLIETLVEEANSNGATNVATAFYDLLNKDNWFTKDGAPAYAALDEAFKETKYDNGKPLTGYNDPKDSTIWHDYFDHYDRDQDYDSMFDDDRVVKVSYVVSDSTELRMFLEFTYDDLLAWVEKEYGGSEYAHDFK